MRTHTKLGVSSAAYGQEEGNKCVQSQHGIQNIIVKGVH